MRDIENTFGTITSAASAASVDFTYGVDAGNKDSLGYMAPLYVVAKVVAGTPSSSETLTLILKDATTAAASPAAIEEQVFSISGGVGTEVRMKIPTTHNRFLALAGKTSATAGVKVTAYLER